ncbi:MAG: hypothetical protein J2P48_17410, partial [Alphaproteobacteria bacterium]|nr:hypothetical protein [Alphaproteobacteria bacterium]
MLAELQQELEFPSLFPARPHLPMNLPSGVKACRRLFPLSTMTGFPFFWTAPPGQVGSMNASPKGFGEGFAGLTPR